VLIIGLLSIALPAAAGGYLCWENRATLVRLQVGDQVWTGHLFGVFVLGVLCGCWFLLGISIVRLRRWERRETRARARTAPRPDADVREPGAALIRR
jgi:hypothetical protein